MRWLGPFFLLFLLLVGCARKEKTDYTLSRFVSENAVMALKINDLNFLKDSLGTNDFISKLADFPTYQKIKKRLGFLKHIEQNSPGLLVFSKNNKDSLDFLYATSSNHNLFIIDSLVSKKLKIIPVGEGAKPSSEFGGTLLYSKIIDDYILISSSKEVLLDDANATNEYKASPLFKKLYQNSDTTKAVTLFLNTKKNDDLLSPFFENLQGLNGSLLQDWTALDLAVGKGYLGLDGVVIPNDSVKNHLGLFKNTEPLPNVTPSFAPNRSDAILSYSFEDYRVFAKNQQHYLQLSSPLDSLFNTVEEIGFIHLNNETAVLLNTHGTENIAEFLVDIRKKATDYQGTIILEVAKTDFLNSSLQPIVADFEAHYSTILENAFVFSKTKNILQIIIGDYKKGNTFLKNPSYRQVMKKSVSAATVLSVSNAKYLKTTLNGQLTKTGAEHLGKANISEYTFVTQIVADGSYFHSNFSALRTDGEQVGKGANEVVKLALEQPLATTPQFVINHLNRKKEIIVQDINNVLYLFSANGKLIWKKKLKSKIQGDIQQVDIFKNGRLQLAFTTNNEFLVLDRNGKEVNLFNKSYEGASLNPLAVFDYDKKREYRFVVTQGKKVFMYDRKGKIVSGFKYTKAEKSIRDAPQHFIIGNKDYLAFVLEDGTFKAFNRKGEPRVVAKEKLDLSNNPLRLYKDKFTATDKKGELCQIDIHGNVKRTSLNLDEFHTMDASPKTLVFLNENVISINGKKTELDLGAYTQPQIFNIANTVYIAVADLQNQKVYVFDERSKLLPNFPLYGNSKIDLGDIDNDGRLELVTQKEDNSLAIYNLN